MVEIPFQIRAVAMKSLTFFLTAFLTGFCAFSQDLSIAAANDSMRTLTLNEIEILSKKFSSKEERIAFEKLKYNTLKVYPYAEIAVSIYAEMKENISGKKRRDKKNYVREVEKKLRDKFEKDIRALSRTQGNILIKLINRNTGNSCYEIVKELKNGLTAFFWNVGGKLYDHELKAKYNPEENADLELILKMIDNGQLQVKSLQ